MSEPAEAVSSLTHEQLPRLHSLTAEIQKICRGQLRTYLDALAPLFRPRRVLGDRMEGVGKESVVGADQTFAELKEIYFKACVRPFDLRKDLASPLESVGTQIALYEWEYLYEVRTEHEARTITIVSPLTWVLGYPSTYSLSMLRQVIAGKQERDAEGVRSSVLRSCLMHLQFTKLPELKALFEGLRFRVEVRRSPQLGELPLVTVSAPIRTIRPADDLLLAATGLSGRTVFEEVIDDYQAAHIEDPLQAQISRVLDGSGRDSAA
jgi:hypothetical protein